MRVLDIAAGRIPSDSAAIDALRPHALPHEEHLTPEELASAVKLREHQRLRLEVVVEGND
jgi:hypothetical protein